ncbi:aminoacyl-tRNA hydrolase [PVC group bacterium]|nr:aminoacyl-tRNA hydrolase [PVC group bacterium]
MKLIVGLGNPGKKYADTPHNAGFRVVQELADGWSEKLRGSWRFSAKIAKAVCGQERVLLVQPQTFMNNSGEAVGSILRYNKLERSDLIVILDDADLAFGRIRIKKQGGSGGHNGLTSVIQHVGGTDFVRVRMGVGRSEDLEDLVSHVLKPFSKKQQEEFEEMVSRTADAVLRIIDGSVDRAMNLFNAPPDSGKED